MEFGPCRNFEHCLIHQTRRTNEESLKIRTSKSALNRFNILECIRHKTCWRRWILAPRLRPLIGGRASKGAGMGPPRAPGQNDALPGSRASSASPFSCVLESRMTRENSSRFFQLLVPCLYFLV